MANNFRMVNTAGQTVDFCNDGALVAAGTVVKLNDITGIILRDVDAGAYGSLHVSPSPIIEGPLDTGDNDDYGFGELVWFDLVAGYCKKDKPGTGFLVGAAVPGANGVIGPWGEADCCAAGGDAIVRIRLISDPRSDKSDSDHTHP